MNMNIQIINYNFALIAEESIEIKIISNVCMYFDSESSFRMKIHL